MVTAHDCATFLFGAGIGAQVGILGAINHGEAINGGHLDLDEEVEAVISAHKLLRVVRRLLVRNLEDADGYDVKVIDHHVELTCVLFIFIL